LRYIRDNPHADALLRAFEVAKIDYGRADYTVLGGRVQIFEINTNPHLPHRTPSLRSERARLVQSKLVESIAELNTPMSGGGRVRFQPARPRAHNLHWPRRRLFKSLARRSLASLTGWRR
jgi:hypothetical protein